MCIRDSPWEYAWVEFDGLRVKEALDLAGLSPDHPIYHSNARDISAELKQLILYIAQHPEMPPLHLIGKLYLLLDCITRSSSSRKPPKTGTDVYKRQSLLCPFSCFISVR